MKLKSNLAAAILAHRKKTTYVLEKELMGDIFESSEKLKLIMNRDITYIPNFRSTEPTESSSIYEPHKKVLSVSTLFIW